MRSTLLSRVLLLHAGASAFRLGTSPALLSRSGLFSATNVVAPAVLLAAKPARAASSVTMSGGDELVAQIQSTVSSSKVVVYSKSYCPFCAKTKALFDSLGVAYTSIELDELEEGPAIQDALLGLTQQRTVPNVFVGGKHLGGNDDTQKAAKSGKLQELLGA